MNLFIIPSWYPSTSNPSYGIFVKEQIEMMARERPGWRIGVSTWGQGDENKLIWAKDHLKNVKKFSKHRGDKSAISSQNGYKEYYQPTLSWTKRLLKGNLNEIIRSNEINYEAHIQAYGKPDVLMVQACYPGIFIADYLSKKYDVPIYLHIRLGGFMFENMLQQLGSMKKNLLKSIFQAKTVVSTSKFHAEELKSWISKIAVLYNPIDLDFFDLSDSSSNYAIAIGRLEEEKGFDLLLDAVAEVSAIKLKIVGDGSEKIELVEKVKKLGLESRIEFVGHADRPKLRELIQNSRYLILPSRYETFGNVLLEAISSGKPVVATKCGGSEEIVTPEAGYLSELTANDLAQEIRKMDEQFDQFNAMEIRRVAEEGFSSKVWIAELEKLLKSTFQK